MPYQVKIRGDRSGKERIETWAGGEEKSFARDVVCRREGSNNISVSITGPSGICLDTSLLFTWHPARGVTPADYVPPPQPVSTGNYLVGAFRCPLWSEETRGGMAWKPIFDYPEREPVLGWYDEADPEVVDWEVKYALEHGISFFIECWYRRSDNAGKPVEDTLSHWLKKGLFKSRYGQQFRFAIMWENINRIASSMSSRQDLMENLMPYWIEHFFSKPNYLKIDGKPVFMIYGYQRFIEDLGGIEEARQTVDMMRQACREAGFGGMILISEHHLPVDRELPEPKAAGFDIITSYHWPSFARTGSPAEYADPLKIKAMQRTCWSGLGEISGLPAIATVSMGWDSKPWGSSYSSLAWELGPGDFKELCRDAAGFLSNQPEHTLSSRMVLLDNWNEYGEGHYIFPTRRFGFGYLEAIREVFSGKEVYPAPVAPEDLGLGPYEHEITIENLKKAQ